MVQAPFFFPRTTRFASFPDYLVIQIKKFTFGLDWVPKKLGMVAGPRAVKQALLEKERAFAHINQCFSNIRKRKKLVLDVLKCNWFEKH